MVIIIAQPSPNIAETTWTVLSDSRIYLDMVWHENMIYALVNFEGIEVWDLNDSVPTIKMSFYPSYPENFDLSFRFDAVRSYLVPSMGEILVIKRYMIFLDDDEDGEGVVDESDLLSDEDSHPLISYRTQKFKILKLDLVNQETFSEVKCLLDQALFIGGNQTLSVSTKDFEGLKRDSVYFTDNYRDGMDEYYLIWGHDVGIFNLGRGSIEMLRDPDRIEPTPFWALPMYPDRIEPTPFWVLPM